MSWKKSVSGLAISAMAVAAFTGCGGVEENAAPVVKELAVQDGASVLLAEALADTEVQALKAFLEERGYVAATERADVSAVALGGNEAEVVLIPFTTADNPDERAAHIAFWVENVQGVGGRNAVAGIDGTEDIYLARGAEVRAQKKDVWSQQLRMPLGSIPRRVPALAQAEGEQVRQGVSAMACKQVDKYRVDYSTLGFVLYKFHQVKDWCYTGSSWSNVKVSVYVSNMDFTVKYRGVIEQWGKSYTNYHDSMRQARMEHCYLEYGCVANSYPAVQIKSYKDGTVSVSTWK